MILERRMKANKRMGRSALGVNRAAIFSNLHAHNQFTSDRPSTVLTSPTAGMHPGLNICAVKTPKTAIRQLREKDYNINNGT